MVYYAKKIKGEWRTGTSHKMIPIRSIGSRVPRYGFYYFLNKKEMEEFINAKEQPKERSNIRN
jgi:hypothetical protein